MYVPRSGVCASPQDLFKQHDNGPLFSEHFREEGLEKATRAFHGGVNMHNVLSEVHIRDKDCPQAAAGLLVSPRNSGIITSTGRSGTLFAIIDVQNEKSTDATKGVELGGDADYLLVGGSNAGQVDITTTGYVSVVGIDNKGEVSAKGASNLVVGNTINSGKVVLAAKTGKIVDVANLPGAEVIIESGTWLFEGHTRNEGVVHVKSGNFTGNVKENAGTIIIDSGVTGKVVFCKAGSGKIQNNAKAEISINAGLCMSVYYMDSRVSANVQGLNDTNME